MHVQKQERKLRTFSLADKVTREGRRVKAFTPIALCTNMLCATGEGVKAKKENRLTRARGLALDARVPAAQSRKKKRGGGIRSTSRLMLRGACPIKCTRVSFHDKDTKNGRLRWNCVRNCPIIFLPPWKLRSFAERGGKERTSLISLYNSCLANLVKW